MGGFELYITVQVILLVWFLLKIRYVVKVASAVRSFSDLEKPTPLDLILYCGLALVMPFGGLWGALLVSNELKKEEIKIYKKRAKFEKLVKKRLYQPKGDSSLHDRIEYKRYLVTKKQATKHLVDLEEYIFRNVTKDKVDYYTELDSSEKPILEVLKSYLTEEGLAYEVRQSGRDYQKDEYVFTLYLSGEDYSEND